MKINFNLFPLRKGKIFLLLAWITKLTELIFRRSSFHFLTLPYGFRLGVWSLNLGAKS